MESKMNHDDQLLTISEVLRLTRLSKPTIYKFINLGRFPRQVHLAPQRVVWVRSEVLAWIAKQAAARSGKACNSQVGEVA
jgi:prophage regulatory protein